MSNPPSPSRSLSLSLLLFGVRRFSRTINLSPIDFFLRVEYFVCDLLRESRRRVFIPRLVLIFALSVDNSSFHFDVVVCLLSLRADSLNELLLIPPVGTP